MKTPNRIAISQRLQRQGLPTASVGEIVRDLREQRDGSKFQSLVVERAVPIDDITIRKDGTGRTVDAYAAVFMTPTEIVDSDGHYMEQNDPGAFNASLAQRRDQIFCIYNHGRTLQGSPSDLYSVPIGRPTVTSRGLPTPLADKHGLLTSTIYNSDPESDRILEAIRSGSLKGMSYTGVFVRSVPELHGPRDFYEPDRDGQLTLVTRMEIALIEYGPTPIPAYDTATVVGVRNRESVTLTRGAARSVPPIHHTPVSYVTGWDSNHTLDQMHFPASQGQMEAMFALYDDGAPGVSNSDTKPTTGAFPRVAGFLPHHDVNADGTPGPANAEGVAQALAEIDTIPDTYAGFTKDDIRYHLNGHIGDMDPAKVGVNSSSEQAEQEPDKLPDVSSSGRQPEGNERALAKIYQHGPLTLKHTHTHEAHDGPDPDGDGIHAHEHSHDGENAHMHSHGAMTGAQTVQVSSSGREADEGKERAGKTYDPDHDGDNDMTPEGDTDHDYWDANGNQIKSLPGKPLGISHAAIVAEHSHKHHGNGAQDADEDGMHEHMHNHAGPDDNHDHHRNWVGMPGMPGVAAPYIGSSGRQPEGTERTETYEEWAERAAAATKDKKPYGNVEYADPKNGKYPIDAEHVVAAWSYINKPENAAKYPLNGVTLASVKAKIKAAMKKYGHQVSDDGGSKSNNGGSKSSSGRQPAASSTGPRNGHSAEPHQHPASSSRMEHGTMMPDNDSRMTVGERIERQSAVRARLAEIDEQFMGAELPADARTEWRQLQEELLTHGKAIKDAQERAQYLAMISDSPDHTEGVDNSSAGFGGNGGGYSGGSYGGGSYDSGFDRSAGRNGGGIGGMRGSGGPALHRDMGETIYDLTAIRNRARSFDELPHLYREFAMRAVERSRFPTPDKTREDCQGTIERMLLNVDDDRGTLARRLLVTGSPTYDRAFGKALQAMSMNGLSAEESRALQLGTDSLGGYAVPFQLDPTVLLTSNGAINPLRQISRIEQIVGKEWDGVTSAGVTVARVAEGTEAASADAAFVQPHVRTTRVQGFVPFNIELDVSWGALRSQMTSLLMDAKDVEEATAFSMGNGTAPNAQGVVQGTHDNSETVSSAGTATLAIGDLYALENAMAPRFRQQSSYLASKTTYNRFRQLFQAQASAAFDSWVRPSAGTPATFNGYPAYEQSQMGTTITSGSFIMLQGDFSKYLIVDRVGMGIELIPHLFGPTNRYPLGQRGILAIWFNNAQILVPNAFRLLVTT